MLAAPGIRTKLFLVSVVSLLGILVVAGIAAHSVHSQMVEDRVTMVRNLTEIAHDLISHSYQSYLAGHLDEESAKREAIERLRGLRYANDEYFFIDDFDGYSVLLPIRPQLEGTYVLDFVDSQGRQYVRMQRDAALSGGGTVSYEFMKPGTMRDGEKLSYVQPFQPWRWFVATGIYLDDVRQETWSVMLRAGTVFFGVAAGVTGLILVLSASITRPLRRLTLEIKRLARREYVGEVPDVDRNDEIGDIARAVALFSKTSQAFEALQGQLRRQEEEARQEREEAFAFQRDSALRIEQTARLASMGEMAVSIAHELNQPLAAVRNFCMGCVRRLRNGSGNEEELTEAMQHAADEAMRAGRIVTRLREMMRQGGPCLQPACLAELIMDTAAIAEIEARRHGFAIRLDIPDALPPVLVDRTMIEQVVFNLLRNATEATCEMPAPRADIRMKAAFLPNGTAVEVSVHDSGPGIPAQDIERVFEPFFTTKNEGMGFGLSICRKMIEFQGGRLTVDPPSLSGTTFRFTLPLASQGHD